VYLERAICFGANRISVFYFDYFGMIAFKPWKGAITWLRATPDEK